ALHGGVAVVGDHQHQRPGPVLDGRTAQPVNLVDAGGAVRGPDDDHVPAQEVEPVGEVEAQVALAVGEVLALDVRERHPKVLGQAAGERQGRNCRYQGDTHRSGRTPG